MAVADGSLDQGHDAGADGLGQSILAVDDGRQVRIGLTSVGGKWIGNRGGFLSQTLIA
jgi:hypothetical protein